MLGTRCDRAKCGGDVFGDTRAWGDSDDDDAVKRGDVFTDTVAEGVDIFDGKPREAKEDNKWALQKMNPHSGTGGHTKRKIKSILGQHTVSQDTN